MTEAKTNKELPNADLIKQIREIAAYAPPYRAMGPKVTSEMVLIALGTESIELADRLEQAEKTITELTRAINGGLKIYVQAKDAEISRLRGLIFNLYSVLFDNSDIDFYNEEASTIFHEERVKREEEGKR